MPKDPTSELAGGAGAPGSTAAAAADTSFFGHPRGLATLFFTEFWERFSYYGMRALLVLFMTQAVAVKNAGLGFNDVRAGAIYGLYTAAVYLLALPGGWVADQILGQRRAVFLGGAIIAAGHFSMAVPSIVTFYLGLVLIVLGTGLLKPNISTMVGELYPEGGARRDAGFSVFYMGINLGAFVSPLVCGWLGERVGWHFGFAAAGIGMVLGLVQYSLGGKYLGQAGLYPNDSGDAQARRRKLLGLAGGAALVVVLALVLGMMGIAIERVAQWTGVVIVGLALVYLVAQLVAGGLEPVEKKRMVVIFVLFVFSALFWAGFEQAGSSLNLFAERLTDRVYFNWEMPTSWLQSVNPILIIALAPVFAWLWVALAKRNLEPSSPAKFAWGLILLGLGFGVMVWAAILTQSQTRQVGSIWLILTYFFHTCGELCLSPVGLSTVTKLAPHRKVGQMMGIWFMSLSLGNLIAGLVAGLFAQLPLPQLFGAVFATTAGAGLILTLFVKPVRRLMGGVH
jgi:proton-dependent oligopeptide transporter, POT family